MCKRAGVPGESATHASIVVLYWLLEGLLCVANCVVPVPCACAPPVTPRRLAATYNVGEGKYRCPVPGCPQGQEGRGCKTPFNLRWHFGYRHPTDEVVVGGECLPRCRLCKMQVAWSVVGTPAHEGSKTCWRMKAQWAQHEVAAAGVRATAHRFTAYGADELRNVLWFKYLGRVTL